MSSTASVVSFGGEFNLGLTAELYMKWLGEEEKILGLPDIINKTLQVKMKFRPIRTKGYILRATVGCLNRARSLHL